MIITHTKHDKVSYYTWVLIKWTILQQNNSLIRWMSTVHVMQLIGSVNGFWDAYSAVQKQKAVSAHFTSEQILPFAFAEQYWSI